jgi:hypothetical protein
MSSIAANWKARQLFSLKQKESRETSPSNIALLSKRITHPILIAALLSAEIRSISYAQSTVPTVMLRHFSTLTLPSFAVTANFSALALVPDKAVRRTGNVLPVSEPLYDT